MYYIYVIFFNQPATNKERKALNLKAGEGMTRKVRYTKHSEKEADEMCLYYRQGGHPAYVEKA